MSSLFDHPAKSAHQAAQAGGSGLCFSPFWLFAMFRSVPRFRVRRSSSGSHARWGCRRWNTCFPGVWPSRRICSAATTSGSLRWPNASATVRRAPSAPRSAGTWASLRVAFVEGRPEFSVRVEALLDCASTEAYRPPSRGVSKHIKEHRMKTQPSIQLPDPVMPWQLFESESHGN